MLLAQKSHCNITAACAFVGEECCAGPVVSGKALLGGAVAARAHPLERSQERRARRKSEFIPRLRSPE